MTKNLAKLRLTRTDVELNLAPDFKLSNLVFSDISDIVFRFSDYCFGFSNKPYIMLSADKNVDFVFDDNIIINDDKFAKLIVTSIHTSSLTINVSEVSNSQKAYFIYKFAIRNMYRMNSVEFEYIKDVNKSRYSGNIIYCLTSVSDPKMYFAHISKIEYFIEYNLGNNEINWIRKEYRDLVKKKFDIPDNIEDANYIMKANRLNIYQSNMNRLTYYLGDKILFQFLYMQFFIDEDDKELFECEAKFMKYVIENNKY
jgi:hypothetical protein